jgi:lysophospholipase L1-like esterase
VKYRGIDLGAWGSRSELRRTGYEYNWARSGARAADLISQGQADGLAAQISIGAVKNVYIQIGVNDFSPNNGTYKQIYDGTISQSQIDSKVDSIVNNITQAINKLQSAGQPKIILASVIDRGPSPNIQKNYPDAVKRKRVTDAIAKTNGKLATMAGSKQVAFIDLNLFGTEFMQKIDASGNLKILSETISYSVIGDEPHHFILGDNEHPGTVGSGFLANYLINQFNATFGMNLNKFTDSEILSNAGINTGVSKVGDVNTDNKVDIIDIGIIIDNYARSPISNSKADINSDGRVDIVDIGIAIDNYGK